MTDGNTPVFLSYPVTAESELRELLRRVRSGSADAEADIMEIFSAPQPATVAQAVQQPSDELVRLVIAARVVAFQDQSPDAIRELDEASEAFAEIVHWEDEPADLRSGLTALFLSSTDRGGK